MCGPPHRTVHSSVVNAILTVASRGSSAPTAHTPAHPQCCHAKAPKADPAAPSHDPQLRQDRPILVYCASGGRSALASKTLKDMGYTDVRNLGGFKGWADSGGAVEK